MDYHSPKEYGKSKRQTQNFNDYDSLSPSRLSPIKSSQSKNTLKSLLEYEKSFLETEQKLMEEKRNLEKRKEIAEEKLQSQTKPVESTKNINLLNENSEIAESLVDQDYIYNIEKEIQIESSKIADLRAILDNPPRRQSQYEVPSNPSVHETKNHIDLVCDSIRRKQQEVKEQKESIKQLERENKQVRDDLEAEYNERNKQIQKLRKIVAKLKQNSESKEQEVNRINELKRKLSNLNETKEELLIHLNRDEIATPKLDDLQNEIEKLKKTLIEKENILRSEKNFYEQVKCEVDSLKNQVSRKEATLEANEKDISRMEEKVDASGNGFDNALKTMKNPSGSATDDIYTYTPHHSLDSKRPSPLELNTNYSSTELSVSKVSSNSISNSPTSPYIDELVSLFS